MVHAEDTELESQTLDELNHASKKIEHEIDGKLLRLGKLVACSLKARKYVGLGPHTGDDSLMEAVDLFSDLQSLLGHLFKLLTAMEKRSKEVLGENERNSLYLISRHREIWREYSTELQRTGKVLDEIREYSSLMTSVRQEIDSYNSQNPDSISYLISESNRIEKSLTDTDRLLK